MAEPVARGRAAAVRDQHGVTSEAERAHDARTLVIALAPIVAVLVGIVLAVVIAPAAGALAVVGLLVLFANRGLGRPERVLAMIGSVPLDAKQEPRLFNLLEGLCVANGLAQPAVEVLEDPAANALAIGRGKKPMTLICTRGLLDTLGRIELEGAVAATLGAVRRKEPDAAARAWQAIGLLTLAPGLAGRTAWALSDPERDVLADRAGASMTRYPPGLMAGLERLEGTPTRPGRLPAVAAALTGPYWLVPFGAPRVATARRGELDLDLRVAALAEL